MNINGNLYKLDREKDLTRDEQLNMFTYLKDEEGRKYMFYPIQKKTLDVDKVINLLKEWYEYKDELEVEREKAKVFVMKLRDLIE